MGNSFLPVTRIGKMVQIYHILPLLFLSVAFLILNTSAYLDDEYYCRRNTTDAQVCHRCLTPEIEGGCPKNETDVGKCYCNNIAVYDGYRDKAYRGGGNCQTEDDYGDFYCYVDASANCSDMDRSIFAGSRKHLWYEKDKNYRGYAKVYYSVFACNDTLVEDQPITGSELVSGSEQFLPGKKISNTDLLKSDTGAELSFTFSDDDLGYGWEKCQAQCLERNRDESVCGAWSFDAGNEKCYLHNVDACCGQRDKQENVNEFISGYVCPHCWSTRNQCPCGIAFRQACLTCQITDGIEGYEDSASLVETTSGDVIKDAPIRSVSTEDVYESPWTIFPCASKPVFNSKTRKWIYKKPCCKENGCNNKSQCQNTC